MLAVVVTGAGSLALAERATPDPRPGSCVVAIERAGLCGTDVSILRGKIPVTYPRVLGHELVGHVAAAGSDVSIEVGTRVLVNPSLACGVCRLCRGDRANLCRAGALIGRDADGGFARSVVVPEHQLLPIPEAYPSTSAASLQVLGTCVHAQRTVDVFPGQTAVVIGLGVSGLLMLQLLRLRGLQVVGVTRAAWKRELAMELGATAVAAPDDAVGRVQEVTDGAGADVVVEAVGTVPTLRQAVEVAAPGGHLVVFGTIGPDAQGSPPFYELYYKELTLHHPRAALHRDYQRAVDLATTGLIDLAPLHTHSFPLERAVEAFATVQDDARALKVSLAVGP